MSESRFENCSPAPATQAASGPTAADVKPRRRRLWKTVAEVLGLAALLTLEVLFLRFGPAMSISAYTVVLIFLGLLVLAVFASEVLSWLLLFDRVRRDRRFKDGPS